jgi:hypothetical protein
MRPMREDDATDLSDYMVLGEDGEVGLQTFFSSMFYILRYSKIKNTPAKKVRKQLHHLHRPHKNMG